MTAQTSQPLPECGEGREDGKGCGRPVRRAVHASTGGLCTPCAAWEHAVAVVGPQAASEGVQQLREWQQTVARIRRAEVLAAAERAHRRRLQARRRA